MTAKGESRIAGATNDVIIKRAHKFAIHEVIGDYPQHELALPRS